MEIRGIRAFPDFHSRALRTRTVGIWPLMKMKADRCWINLQFSDTPMGRGDESWLSRGHYRITFDGKQRDEQLQTDDCVAGAVGRIRPKKRNRALTVH